MTRIISRRRVAAASRRLLMALVVGGVGLWAGVVPAWAGAIERVEPADLAATPFVSPGSEPMALRGWVQLVWDPLTQKLARRFYSFWDPIASLDLDLQWLADDPAADGPGSLDGMGTLTFRRQGAPTYDPKGAVAQYRGEVVAGRANGSGEFLHVSGFSYSGQWRDGAMHGEGRLSLPNGDQYVGGFASGKRHGAGVYIDATGAIFDGRFAGDVPDGSGIFVPANGLPYRADWAMGQEISGTRLGLGPGQLDYPQLIDAQYESYDDLRIGVIAERLPRVSEFAPNPLSYTSLSAGQTLEIFPDDKRLLGVWKGTMPIQMSYEEKYEFGDYNYSPSFLGAYQRFEPVSLIFELENISTDGVAVVGAFLDVETSKRDPEPAVQLRSLANDGCSGGESFHIPRFRFDNFGWTEARNAEINFTFGSVDGDVEGTGFSQAIGTFEQSLEVSVEDAMANLGVNSALLTSERLRCTDMSDERQCLAEVAESGNFGELAGYLSLLGTTIQAAATGTLDYDWTDADGKTRHKSSPFSTELAVGEVYTEAECGEGGEVIPVSHDPFVFKLDESGYRIGIPIVDEVAAGFTGRWRVKFSAPESSVHEFRLVLVLADGREVASRPIKLLYFMPPKDFDPYG